MSLAAQRSGEKNLPEEKPAISLAAQRSGAKNRIPHLRDELTESNLIIITKHSCLIIFKIIFTFNELITIQHLP